MSPPASCCGTRPRRSMTLPAKPPTRILVPFRSATDLDLLAEPAAHLGAGIAAQEVDDAVALEELAHQLLAAALLIPGGVLARGQAERHRAVEGEGGVLAEVIVGGGVAHFDGAGLDRIHDLQAGHDFAGGERADIEFAAGQFGHALGEGVGGTEDGVERFREAAGEAPVDGGQRLGQCRCGDCADAGADGCFWSERNDVPYECLLNRNYKELPAD
jgi:hypothetical protein